MNGLGKKELLWCVVAIILKKDVMDFYWLLDLNVTVEDFILRVEKIRLVVSLRYNLRVLSCFTFDAQR